MPLDRVNAYVKEKGFDAAKKRGPGRTIRYTRLSLKTRRGKTIPTGLPTLVLEKNGSLKWITGKEVFCIFDEIFR